MVHLTCFYIGVAHVLKGLAVIRTHAIQVAIS